MDSKQGMEFSIDRIPGQWLAFARDWRPASTTVPEALCTLTDAMDALLHAQRRTSSLLARGAACNGAQQFTAAFGVSHWFPASESLLIDRLDQEIHYTYQAGGQVCFKGRLTSILAPDDFGTYREPHAALNPELTLHKLYQFNDMFPWAKRLWIYLNTLVTSHFLAEYLKQPSYAVEGTPTRLLGYKVQFDQRTLASRTGLLGTNPLHYAATTFEVGHCDAITLTVYLCEKLLMRIDLGLVKPSTETSHEGLLPA